MMIVQRPMWRSCCFFPFLWMQLACHAGPWVWQMGRGFWVSYPCGWNLGCQIAIEFAVIAGLLNWQTLPLHLGFIHFSIIMIYGSLFQTRETSTLWLFQKPNRSVFLKAQETCNSVQIGSHTWYSLQYSQHTPVFLGKVPFPESSPSRCSIAHGFFSKTFLLCE